VKTYKIRDCHCGSPAVAVIGEESIGWRDKIGEPGKPPPEYSITIGEVKTLSAVCLTCGEAYDSRYFTFPPVEKWEEREMEVPSSLHHCVVGEIKHSTMLRCYRLYSLTGKKVGEVEEGREEPHLTY